MEKRLSSEKQLEKLLERDGRVIAFLFQNKIPTLVEIAKSKSSRSFCCFTNILHHRSFGSSFASEDIDSPILNDCRLRFSYLIYFNNLRELFSMSMNEYGIIMPNDFNERYNNFITSNKKAVFQVISKYCGTPNNDTSKYIFSITESPNYFVWALKLVMSQCVSTAVIRTIMIWVKNHQDLLKSLSRHTITAYINSHAICELGEEFMHIRALKRANATINEFNTAQKRLFKEEIAKEKLSSLQLKTLDEFSKLSDAKRRNFIRKVSTIENIGEIFRLMEILVSTKFSWNPSSVKEFIEVGGLNSNIIYEKDNILLCEVLDYDAIKKMAKTTNWCIAKNKRYWSQYLCGDAKQYVLFNFNDEEDGEMSIVGFTSVSNNGITNAHSFTNTNLIQGGEHAERRRFYYAPIIPQRKINDIYSFLNKHNVPLNLIIRYNTSFGEWNEKYILKRFSENFDEYSYDILENKNGKLVMRIDWDSFVSGNFRNIANLNRNLLNYVNSPKYVLIFFDFTKSIDDLSKVQFAVIEENSRCQMECCTNVFTEFIYSEKSFDELLDEFGLPKTLIKRINSITSSIMESIYFGDFETFFKILKSDGGIKEFKKLIRTNSSFREYIKPLILTSVERISFEFVNAIYDCGECISSIFDEAFLADFVRKLYYMAFSYPLERPIDLEKSISLVLNGAIKSGSFAYAIACYYMLHTAFMHETNKTYFIDVILSILYSESGANQKFVDIIVNLFIDSIDLTKWEQRTHNLFTIICNYDCQNALRKVLNANLSKRAISFIVSRLHYDNPMVEFATARKKEIVGS